MGAPQERHNLARILWGQGGIGNFIVKASAPVNQFILPAVILIIFDEYCSLWIPIITTAGGGPGDAPEGLRTEVNASEIGVVKLYFLLG